MQGFNPILEKEFLADGAIASDFLIVKKGTNEDDVATAAAATSVLLGVAQHDAADNARVRVMVAGISKVKYGGTVTQGQLLTTDASGQAVAVSTLQPLTPEYVIGIAMANGVSGDVGRVLVCPSKLQAANVDMSKTADGAVTAYQVVKRGTAAVDVATATAVTEEYLGVAQATAIDNAAVVIRAIGITNVLVGGTIAAGDKLTVTAGGKVVAAAPALGVNNHIIGVALEDGADTETKLMVIAPSVMQGA